MASVPLSDRPRAMTISCAVDALVRARKTGRQVARLPESLTTAEGFAVQDAVAAMLGETIGGWKCGMPQGDRLIAAPIFASLIQAAAVPVKVRSSKISYEPELAFCLARDVPRGATRHDVIAALGETRIALELMHGRYADPAAVAPNDLLADNLYNEGLVLGPVIDPLLPISTITVRDSSGVRRYPAVHPAGDPLAPLVWLANNGPHALKLGMTIITGSFIAPQPLVADATVEITFGDAGTLTTMFEFEEFHP